MARSRDWLAHIGIQRRGKMADTDRTPEQEPEVTQKPTNTDAATGNDTGRTGPTKTEADDTTSDRPTRTTAPVANTVAPATVAPKPQKRSDLQEFLKLTGYKESDVLDYNSQSHAFVTKNGGKYVINRRNRVRVVSGPDYPNMTQEEAED
jgi:hypothetical protein